MFFLFSGHDTLPKNNNDNDIDNITYDNNMITIVLVRFYII